ncbi:energy transducer TonB [Flagellimonas sp. S174]|uniref:energy transducer TonB n=1 Tax=Flagellimonas sp. S174 TaxID=3410790 RepID=UPI003BF55CD8
MKPKKNPNAEIGRNSSLYFMIGLTSILFVTWQALEVKVYDKETEVLDVVEVMDNLDEEVPVTKNVITAPPPPPPSAPDVIEIVEDMEDVEETIIESTESSQDLYIEDAIVKVDDVEVGEEEEEISIPFAIIENAPVYPGCDTCPTEQERRECFNQKIQEHIKKNLKYPVSALEMRISGRVFIKFDIDSKGRVTNIQKRGPDRLLEDEAVRLIAALPTMKPGMQRGKATKISYAIPINFMIK